MKLSTILLTLCLAIPAMAQNLYRVALPVDHVYSPRGFDSNDNSQIVVEGFLPNLCYKSPRHEFKVEGKNIYIEITALKNSQSLHCAEVVVPFLEVINLGTLDRGSYNVVVNGNSFWKTESEFFVSDALVATIDSNTYANVEYVEKNLGSWEITLKGLNPNGCYRMEDVVFTDNGSDTYSVLPKMTLLEEDCKAELTPFEITASVPKTLRREKVLLHVRTMGGRSVNTLFYQPKK